MKAFPLSFCGYRTNVTTVLTLSVNGRSKWFLLVYYSEDNKCKTLQPLFSPDGLPLDSVWPVSMNCLIPPRDEYRWKDGFLCRVVGEGCSIWFWF